MRWWIIAASQVCQAGASDNFLLFVRRGCDYRQTIPRPDDSAPASFGLGEYSHCVKLSGLGEGGLESHLLPAGSFSGGFS